ncbi:MAG: sporulation protein YunB [Candidatus Saccharibacteria bacterium]
MKILYSRWRRIKITILFILFVSLVLFILTEISLRGAILTIARSKVQLEGQQIMARAVAKETQNLDYTDLVSIHKDNDGQIVLIQPNTIKMNSLMSRTLITMEKEFAGINDEEFSIPLGQVLGSSILAGYGPGIKVKVMPVGQVKVDLMDGFKGAGINQTRHLIWLKVSAKMKIAIPFSNEEVDVASQIPVAETIIVGKVPGTYMNFTNNGDMF